MVLNDKEIIKQCSQKEMVHPFVNKQVKTKVINKKEKQFISYGVSSFGYDIRLSKEDFYIFKKRTVWQKIKDYFTGSKVIDPKRFNTEVLTRLTLQKDGNSSYFLLPSMTYALGVSHERFKIPSTITSMAIGKSTYARSGLLVNCTPLEAGWEGYLTIEFANMTPFDMRLYADEGILQLVFWEGNQPEVTYADRAGKYQGQQLQVTMPRV